MTKKIKLLDETTINQIAAGEVIENPASVVKELVENSLDAQSTEISVEIQVGGRQLIRIVDNGCGMSFDDAILSLERHATSKIRSIEDTFSLITLGFRGEALPSIASIAKVHILTAEEEGSDKEGGATFISVEGGKILSHEKAIRNRGTTIEVKNLFFNVPVRKKFQRSPSYDTAEVVKVVTGLAMAHPNVRFTLVCDKKTEFALPASNKASFLEGLKERLPPLLMAQYSEEGVGIDTKIPNGTLKGLLVKPHQSRPNRLGQHIFLNGRSIISPSISRAVKDGYGHSLEENRFPLFILFLDIEGDLVDVNVHPQKREVRLRNQGTISESIRISVEKALNPFSEFKQASVETSVAPLPFRSSWKQEPLFLSPIPQNDLIEEESLPLEIPPKVIASLRGYLFVEPQTVKKLLPVARQQEGFVVIDVEAALQKILERGSQTQVIATQHLLLPFHLETTSFEAQLLEEHLSFFYDTGISLTRFGPTTFVVDTIPNHFTEEEIKTWIHHCLEVLKEDGVKQSISLFAETARFFSTKTFSLQEGTLLVKQLLDCVDPLRGKKGELTTAFLTPSTLAQLFRSGGKSS